MKSLACHKPKVCTSELQLICVIAALLATFLVSKTTQSRSLRSKNGLQMFYVYADTMLCWMLFLAYDSEVMLILAHLLLLLLRVWQRCHRHCHQLLLASYQHLLPVDSYTQDSSTTGQLSHVHRALLLVLLHSEVCYIMFRCIVVHENRLLRFLAPSVTRRHIQFSSVILSLFLNPD